MSAADIDYDLEIGGLRIMLTVFYELEFRAEGRGTSEVRVIMEATPQKVQTMIGGMPFREVLWTDVPRDYPLRSWIEAKAKELTPEDCGYTEREALQEAIEEEDEARYWANQIGRPL